MRIQRISIKTGFFINYFGLTGVLRKKLVLRFSAFEGRRGYKFLLDRKVNLMLKTIIGVLVSKFYGFGLAKNKKVIALFGVGWMFNIKRFRARQLLFVRKYSVRIFSSFLVGKALHNSISHVFRIRKAAGTYCYIRINQGLPFKGQRTHTNASTAKYLRKKVMQLLK